MDLAKYVFVLTRRMRHLRVGGLWGEALHLIEFTHASCFILMLFLAKSCKWAHSQWLVYTLQLLDQLSKGCATVSSEIYICMCIYVLEKNTLHFVSPDRDKQKPSQTLSQWVWAVFVFWMQFMQFDSGFRWFSLNCINQTLFDLSPNTLKL